MRLKKLLLPLLFSLTLLLTSCGKLSIPTNANTAFSNFTLCLFRQEVSSNTINLHYSLQEPEKYGITNVPITLGSFDVNETSALASIENLENALSKFSYNALSDENKLTYDVLCHYFAGLKNDITYYLYDEPLSPVTGIHAQLPVLLAEYQLTNQKDVESYLALLQTLPDYFSSLIRFEQQKSANGLFMSDIVADAVIGQCNAFVSMADNNYLLSTFEERLEHVPGLSVQKRSAYILQNKETLENHVFPAYKKLASSLALLKGSGENEKGLCFFSEGSDYYAVLVASETGSSRSIPEMKKLIANQMASDLLSSQSILQDNPTILEQTGILTETPDTILQSLQTRISKAFPDAASVNVRIKYVPNGLQEYLSPAFYLIPAIDNFSENTIYINPSYSLDDMHLFTTLAHEGYPGHLYQTTYFANTSPDPVRTILNFSGYVEGWATYAEMCSYYISSLEKLFASLLQKNNSFILGLYAMTDIGIHYDGWSMEDTITFFADYGIDDKTAVQEIYQYIVGDPANYLTYYMGYLEILELKKEYMEMKGDSFSNKEFHKQILEIGPAPFEVLRKYMLGTQ